jgi:hypothetical protein
VYIHVYNVESRRSEVGDFTGTLTTVYTVIQCVWGVQGIGESRDGAALFSESIAPIRCRVFGEKLHVFFYQVSNN